MRAFIFRDDDAKAMLYRQKDEEVAMHAMIFSRLLSHFLRRFAFLSRMRDMI